MTQQAMVIIAVFLTSGICSAGDKPVLKSQNEKINYSVGYQLGGDFSRQGVELVPDALLQGIRDALAKKSSAISPEEMRTILVNLKKNIVAGQVTERQRLTEQYRGEGREFLAANAKKQGVVTLPSGLQYKVLKAGAGKSPTLKDTVVVNYKGTRIDGQEFDSSYRDGKPADIPLDKVIPGWKEALPLMKEGARWQLFIPADLAFGERGPLADRTVIYEIVLLTVKAGE
jgi:FKBP-type peptidyl-prolyl cis-trans isomerase FklB